MTNCWKSHFPFSLIFDLASSHQLGLDFGTQPFTNLFPSCFHLHPDQYLMGTHLHNLLRQATRWLLTIPRNPVPRNSTKRDEIQWRATQVQDRNIDLVRQSQSRLFLNPSASFSGPTPIPSGIKKRRMYGTCH